MNYVLDIETMPNKDLIDLLPEVKTKATLVDPAKISKDIAIKKAEQISKMALNPLFAKICCIGVYGKNFKKCFMGTNEKETLIDFYSWLISNQANDSKTLITYNGNNFDLPMIFKRMAILEVTSLAGVNKWTKKYNNDYHIDIMQEFCGFGQYEKLNTLTRVILGESKLDFDVTKNAECMETEEGRKLLSDYCMQDCKVTYDLADRFGYIIEK